MKKGKLATLLVLLVIFLGLGICFVVRRVPPAAVIPSQEASAQQPSLEVIKNAQYQLKDGEIHNGELQYVKDGRYDFTFQQGKDGAGATVKGSLVVDTEHIAFGDIDYGWKDITVVPTIENYGGSGQYVKLQVLQGSNARFISSLDFGDRTEIRSLRIQEFPASEKGPAQSLLRVEYNAKYPLAFKAFRLSLPAGEGYMFFAIINGKLFPPEI